jgi:hypothetical protein
MALLQGAGLTLAIAWAAWTADAQEHTPTASAAPGRRVRLIWLMAWSGTACLTRQPARRDRRVVDSSGAAARHTLAPHLDGGGCGGRRGHRCVDRAGQLAPLDARPHRRRPSSQRRLPGPAGGPPARDAGLGRPLDRHLPRPASGLRRIPAPETGGAARHAARGPHPGSSLVAGLLLSVRLARSLRHTATAGPASPWLARFAVAGLALLGVEAALSMAVTLGWSRAPIGVGFPLLSWHPMSCLPLAALAAACRQLHRERISPRSRQRKDEHDHPDQRNAHHQRADPGHEQLPANSRWPSCDSIPDGRRDPEKTWTPHHRIHRLLARIPRYMGNPG